jgi:tripartite-type tricarboxylate transporter receptor subunit TctC
VKQSLLLAALLAILCALAARAQDDAVRNYPQRTIRMIVPYAPGGGTDILGRVAGKEISEALGQPVVIENKPGASAIIGTDLVARSKPDGYTLLVAPSGPMVMNPVLRKSLPYSPQTDFVPISIMGRLPLIVTVNAALPVKSIKELIDYAKARPDNVTYASSAPLFLLATELFKQKTGTNFLPIPYKSSGESAVALLSGQVTLSISDVPPVAGLIKDGKLRALAYTDERRSAEFPDVPTVAEAGVGGHRGGDACRHRCASGDAGPDRAQAAGHPHPHGAEAGRARPLRHHRRRARGQHVGGVCQGHQGGHRALGRSGQARQHREGVIAPQTGVWPMYAAMTSGALVTTSGVPSMTLAP